MNTQNDMDDEKAKFQADKYVKVMFDYCSSGLWDREGCGVDAQSLPVPKDLRERIEAWVNAYDRTSSQLMTLEHIEDPTKEETAQIRQLRKACRKHFSEQVCIAIEVKTLLPDWTVTVFHEEEGLLELPMDEGRKLSEIPLGYGFKPKR